MLLNSCQCCCGHLPTDSARCFLGARLSVIVRPTYTSCCMLAPRLPSISISVSNLDMETFHIHSQIYRCDHLRVVLVSPPMSKRISCLESWGNEHTFVGSGNEVLGWRRLTCLGTLGSHPGTVRKAAYSRDRDRYLAHGDGPVSSRVLVGCVCWKGRRKDTAYAIDLLTCLMYFRHQ